MKRIFIFAFILSVCVFLPAYAGSQSYNPIGKGCTNAFYIDKDCDGYGVASPLGVDADDNDPEVNTPETVIAKYGTLENFLHHLGYYPERIFYISANGDDDNGEVDNINKPYKTWDAVESQLQPGDAVIFRGGVYDYLGDYAITCGDLNGTADKPVIIMAYPGENVIIDAAENSISMTYASYLVFDGFIIDNLKDEWGRGINGHYFDHVTFRNIESMHHSSGWHTDAQRDVVIENCVFHDNSQSHGIYLNSYVKPLDKWGKNIIVRNCISYRNGRHGIQCNGIFDNVTIENNIFHSNTLGGISLLNGVCNSIVRNNLVFVNQRAGVIFFNYCSYDWFGAGRPAKNNNIINNLFYIHKSDEPGILFNDGTNGNCGGAPGFDPDNFTMKENIIRNNIIIGGGWGGAAPIDFRQYKHFSFTAIDNNIFYRSSGDATTIIKTEGDFYTVGEAENLSNQIKNNLLADPKFTNVSIDYNLNPEKFNFDYLSNSSVRDFGTPVDAPSIDLRGNPRDENSDAGCYEYGWISANKPPVANAGEDIIVVDLEDDWRENITLNASQSYDQDGQIIHYLWYERGEQLGNQKVITLPFSVGTHQVKLMTIDNKGALSYDMISVEVKPGPNIIILKDGLHRAIRSDMPDKHVTHDSWTNMIGNFSNQIWRLFLIFNNLDSILGDIPEDNQIVESKLKLYEYSYFEAEGKSVSIYSLKHSFDTETVTWNNYSEGNLWSTPGAYDENDIDITPLATVTLNDQINIWREWNITDYVKALRNGTKQNYGLLIKQDNESEGGSRYKMTNDPDESLRPQLVIIFSKSLVIIIDDSLPDATLGEQYNYSLNVVGGNPPYNFSLSSGDLPGGISLSSDGELSGIPNQTGTFNFIIQVEDLVNETSAKEFNLTVNSG